MKSQQAQARHFHTLFEGSEDMSRSSGRDARINFAFNSKELTLPSNGLRCNFI